MQQAGEILQNTIAYRQKAIVNTIAYSKIKPFEADRILESVSDLIDDKKYKPFFYKRLYILGPTKFLELADRARKGSKSKSGLFCKLMRSI